MLFEKNIIIILKKFKYIFSLILFLVSTTGISIYKHYSAGKLYDVAIFQEAETCCEYDCGCCEIEFEYLHISDNYELPASEKLHISVLDLFQNTNFAVVLFNVKPIANCNRFLNVKNCLKEKSIPLPSEIPTITQSFLC